MIYVGIDNGTDATIAAVLDNGKLLFHGKVPVKTELGFQKKARNITRVDFGQFVLGLKSMADEEVRVFVEHPAINPMMGVLNCCTAARAYEAVLIACEMTGIPVRTIASSDWQKKMLPAGLKGRAVLKAASADIGTKLFPYEAGFIKQHKDADGLLIAECARRERW